MLAAPVLCEFHHLLYFSACNNSNFSEEVTPTQKCILPTTGIWTLEQ